MASCHRCGQSIRWVEVAGERLALDSFPQLRPPGTDLTLYRLVAEEAGHAEAMKGSRPDMHGYPAHQDTCPSRLP